VVRDALTYVSSDLSPSCLANCAKRALRSSIEATEANCESELLLMILDVLGVLSDVGDGCSLEGCLVGR
jgi:hypothetical protein